MEEQQLRWVQKNRQEGCGTRRVGEVARELIDSAKVTGSPWRWRILAVLEAHGGPALLERARVVDVRNGELIMQVTEPADLYHLRLIFEQRLLDAIDAELPEATIHGVRFVVGVGSRP